jgi:large subunit ribosomal protein L22
MQFKASHRYARMGARKARLVVDLIRGRTVNQALDTLDHDNHRAAFYLRKVLASAVANALQNPDVRASRLVVRRAYVNEGPLLQGRMRWRPGPMGRAMPFRRRTCHIHVEVEDPEVKAAEVEAPPSPAEAPAEEAPKQKTKKTAAKKTAAKKADDKKADDKKADDKKEKGDEKKAAKKASKKAAPKKAAKKSTEKAPSKKKKGEDKE